MIKEKLLQRCLIVSKACGVIALVVAMLVLIGWLFDIRDLKFMISIPVSMKFNTAMGILFISLALLLWHARERIKFAVVLSQLLGFLALLLGVLTISEYVFSCDLRIDQLVFLDYEKTMFPGRPSILTVIIFVCLGGALLLLPRQRGNIIFQLLLLLATLIAFISILGHSLNISATLFGFIRFTTIATHTSISLLLLSLGIFLSRPQFEPLSYLVAESMGASFFRKTWPTVIIIFFAIAYLRFPGERAGLYDSAVGLGLFLVAIVVVVTVAFWRSAKAFSQMEMDVRALNHNLARSNKELEEFSRVASHDLQEPLRKVQAFGEILKNEISKKLTEGEKELLDKMGDSVQRMKNLIEDLLSLARVTSGEQSFQVVDMHKILRDVQDILEMPLQNKGGKLEIGVLPTIEADPFQMRQLFQNLIGNAIKFTSIDRPPIIKIFANGLYEQGRLIEIVVEDNGIGFEQKYADKIFIPLQRLHSKGQYEGSGIGLSICSRIVERHRGTIRAESTLGKGARFIIRLPLKQT